MTPKRPGKRCWCSPWKKLSRRRGISVQLAPRILGNGYDVRNELYRFLRASSPQHSEALVRKTGSADPKMPNACGPAAIRINASPPAMLWGLLSILRPSRLGAQVGSQLIRILVG
jgi:hypothetical protein